MAARYVRQRSASLDVEELHLRLADYTRIDLFARRRCAASWARRTAGGLRQIAFQFLSCMGVVLSKRGAASASLQAIVRLAAHNCTSYRDRLDHR